MIAESQFPLNSVKAPPCSLGNPAVVLAEDRLGRRPRLIRSTQRTGLVPESRRALCWHRPPVLLPRGATRAKLCKCRQGRTPQNFDRVLAAACLYRDMLSCQTHLSESAMMAQHSDVGRRRHETRLPQHRSLPNIRPTGRTPYPRKTLQVSPRANTAKF